MIMTMCDKRVYSNYAFFLEMRLYHHHKSPDNIKALNYKYYDVKQDMKYL